MPDESFGSFEYRLKSLEHYNHHENSCLSGDRWLPIPLKPFDSILKHQIILDDIYKVLLISTPICKVFTTFKFKLFKSYLSHLFCDSEVKDFSNIGRAKYWIEPILVENNYLFSAPIKFCSSCFIEQLENYGFTWFKQSWLMKNARCGVHDCELRLPQCPECGHEEKGWKKVRMAMVGHCLNCDAGILGALKKRIADEDVQSSSATITFIHDSVDIMLHNLAVKTFHSIYEDTNTFQDRHDLSDFEGLVLHGFGNVSCEYIFNNLCDRNWSEFYQFFNNDISFRGPTDVIIFQDKTINISIIE